MIDSEIENMTLEEKLNMLKRFNTNKYLSSVTELICGGTALSMEVYYIFREVLYFLRNSSHELDVKEATFVGALVFANTCLSISQGLIVEDCDNIVKKLEMSIKNKKY